MVCIMCGIPLSFGSFEVREAVMTRQCVNCLGALYNNIGNYADSNEKVMVDFEKYQHCNRNIKFHPNTYKTVKIFYELAK